MKDDLDVVHVHPLPTKRWLPDIDTPTLRDLWSARYGDDWVPLSDTARDAFYRQALDRFVREQLIEHTYLISERRTVVRLKRTEDKDADR
jgi:hypothetical protein